MKWREAISAFWLPVKASFDLTASERRFVLGLLLLFSLGLGARWLHQRKPPQTTPAPTIQEKQP